MIKTALSRHPFFIDTKAIKRSSFVYRAINHSSRLKILEIIHKIGSINVTPIIQQLGLEQSLVSAHLKILRSAKIVNTSRKGNKVFYSINYEQVNRLSILADKLIPYRTDTSGFLQNADRNLVLKLKDDTVTFTPIELKIIDLVCGENSDEEIASVLDLTQNEIENYISAIIRKMKVKGSVGILLFSVKHGLFKA